MADRLRILIVEDDDILSANLFTAIEDRNCSVVGPVATVADALALLGREGIDGAVLDASLPDRDVTPVAVELIDKAIPFVIHTGVGLPAELATVFPHVSVIMKPADPDDVIAKLLAQLQALSGSTPGEDGRQIADLDAGQDRARQIEQIASALFDQFGTKALLLAQRQAADARGDSLISWSDIIENLEKRDVAKP